MKKCDMINMHKLTLLSFSITALAALCFSGCGWFSKTETKEKESKLVVINVLDKEDYDDCHITGSINIPFEELEKQLSDLNKNDRYVVYCSNYACTAAPFSAKTMKDAGFEHVEVYHGGMAGWYQEKYPCSGPCEKPYLQDANDKLDDEEPLQGEQHSGIVDISAEELKSKMTEAGLLKA